MFADSYYFPLEIGEDQKKAFVVRDNAPHFLRGFSLLSLARPAVLNLFCLIYPLPKERSIIYPQCTTTAFSLLKIKVFFSL